MKSIHTEIEIQASDERVWDVLTDLATYPEWNPLIRQASGNVTAGEHLELHIHPPGLSKRTFLVKILRVEPRREFRWLGRVLMPGLLDGDHNLLIEPIGTNRVRLVQREDFSGLLVPFCARWLVRNMRQGFEEMNLALKKRAEQIKS